MHDYQKKLLEAYCESDTKMVISMGRQTGKSTIVKNWAKTLQDFMQPFGLIPSTGKVFGQDYYCIEPVGFMWQTNPWGDMEKWCEEKLGPTSTNGVWTPNMRWYGNNRKFWFRDEKDRTMFVLKWS